jgi:CO/xanthine dehydrogenase Mo-binding subunit
VSTGFSRRDFLRASGALVVSFSAGAAFDPLARAQGPFDTHGGHIDPARLDSWIAVGADGRVTAYTGKCDLGQGMLTVQTQLVAEELSVPLDRVRLIQCDTSVTPDQGTTSGSQSTPTNFNARSLAQAAATAREALIGLAAARLGVPASQLEAEGGAVKGPGGARVTYGELIGGGRFDLQVSATARRKSPDRWTTLGKPIGRLDMAELATGRFEFVHNVRVPGMLHGRVVRPPQVGATVVSVDEASVSHLPGVVRVVVRKNFVGVVAEKQWQAVQAAEALKATWTGGTSVPGQSGFFDEMRRMPSRDTRVVDSKDVEQTLAKAGSVVRATYLHPYQAHGPMGTSCAVADVRRDGVTLWSPTQSVYPTRSCVAMLTGLNIESVRVIFVRGSGCYGLNGADAASFDAAILSQAVGRPVRLLLSRQDEMAWDNYGSPYVIDQRAGVGADGTIIAWDHESWSASRGGRPGYERPGNVVTGMLAGYEPETVAPRAAPEPAGVLRNGGNAVPSYVAGCIGDRCGGAGSVRSERVVTHVVNSPFFTGPLRSPSRLQNTFAHESFLDELAAHVKADPVAYRLRHLRDPRLIDVVRTAAKAAGWEARPSPAAGGGAGHAGPVRGRGFACVAYEGDNGYAAMAAEIEVDRSTGAVNVKRLVMAVDCGPVSNPDGVRNQCEGGALQGLSRALGEEVTWDAGRVTSIDWATYRSLPLGIDVPRVETVLLDRHDVSATGVGETTITLAAPALANAIFDATGARLRQIPLTPDRLKAALDATRS